MRRLFRTVFFLASFMMCCLIFNCDEVFAATTTTCMKDENKGVICNICNTPSCSHVNGRSYDNIVYYFYTSDIAKRVSQDKTKLASTGEVKENNIVAIQVNDKGDFINNWNSMGTYNGKLFYIRAVVINMHGIAEEASIGDQTGLNNKCSCDNNCTADCDKDCAGICQCECNCKENGGCACHGYCGIYITKDDLEDLTIKPVERLILLTCYGAYQYFANNDNTASVLSTKVDGDVIAGSAKVFPYHMDGVKYYIYYVDSTYAEDNNGVYDYSLTYKDGYDWILYKNGSYVKKCAGDGYTLAALLNLGKTYEEEE